VTSRLDRERPKVVRIVTRLNIGSPAGNGPLTVGWFGRMVPVKNIALLAATMENALQRSPGIRGIMLTGIFYPALTFAYPIFDTVLVSALRKLAGQPISMGGRDHSSHRLASLGIDQRLVVWILWLLTAFGASLGILIRLMPDALFTVGALLLGMLSMLALSLAKLPGYPLPAWTAAWMRQRAGRVVRTST
jgi:hypothetical protein